MTDAQEIYICHEDELTDPGSKGFESRSPAVTGFLVRLAGTVTAFENRCPHTGVALNWLPDQFLDYENEYIQCSMHGALFRISDGACIYGPCNGKALRALPVRIREGRISVLVDGDEAGV